MSTLLLLIAVFALTAAFSFVVAGRDTPNAVALPIASGALTPTNAVAMTAVMRMIGAVMGVSTIQFFAAEFVALVPSGNTGLAITAVGVATALAWAIFTWWRGVAVSSSHALTASITGGAIAVSLLSSNHLTLTDLSPIAMGIIISLFASPILAMLVAWLLTIPVTWFAKDTAPHRVSYAARGALAIGSAANALGHGVQYGQRIYIVLLMSISAAGVDTLSNWVIAASVVLLLGLGSMVTAWRVNYTLARRITILDPLHSAVASSTSALLLLIGSFMLHIPLSSSLTTVAAITGAGTAQNNGVIRWVQVLRLMSYFFATVIICAVIAFAIVGVITTLV